MEALARMLEARLQGQLTDAKTEEEQRMNHISAGDRLIRLLSPCKQERALIKCDGTGSLQAQPFLHRLWMLYSHDAPSGGAVSPLRGESEQAQLFHVSLLALVSHPGQKVEIWGGRPGEDPSC